MKINSVSSQVWSIFLIFLGVLLLPVLALAHLAQNLQSAIIGTSGLLVGGGLTMLEHQPAEKNEQGNTNSTE